MGNRTLQLGVIRTMMKEEQGLMGAQEGAPKPVLGVMESFLKKIILMLEAVS